MDRDGYLQLSSQNSTKSKSFQFLSFPDDDKSPQVTYLSFQRRDISKNFLYLDTESHELPLDNSQNHKSFVENRVEDPVEVAKASIQTSLDNSADEVEVLVPAKANQKDSAVQTETELTKSPLLKSVQDPFHQVTWISRANELKLQGYRSLILNENTSLLYSSRQSLSSMAFQL
jgi:hypothetical protein